MKIRLTLVAGLLAGVAGCSTTGPNQGTGGLSVLTPGGGGGKVASNIIAAMGGGLVGGSVGAGLSEREKRRALEAEYKALEHTASGQAVSWKGDQPAHYGEVVAAQPYRVGSQDCRQYAHTVYAGGAGSTARGTACRNADGSWTLLN
jgi:surface antigen